jgi:hypothetical protein
MIAVVCFGRIPRVVERLAEDDPARLGKFLGDDRNHLVAQEIVAVGGKCLDEAIAPDIAEGFGILQQHIDSKATVPDRDCTGQNLINDRGAAGMIRTRVDAIGLRGFCPIDMNINEPRAAADKLKCEALRKVRHGTACVLLVEGRDEDARCSPALRGRERGL